MGLGGVGIRRGWGASIALVLALGIALGSGTATAAEPAAAGSAPRLTLAAPSRVEVGKRVVLRGVARGWDGGGRVLLERRSGGGWVARTGTGLRDGRFQATVRFRQPATERLRATLVVARHPVASSPVRRITVRARPTAPVPPPPPALAPAPAVATPVPAPPETALYWGAWIGPQFTGTPAPTDMDAVGDFEAISRKPLSILETYSSWKTCPTATCPGFVRFPAEDFDRMRAYGAIPLYSWASEGNPPSPDSPEFQLADIVERDFDGYITKWAEEAKAWGHPFFLRFDWEMNGTWFPWGEAVNGNQPGDFIAAWQHVHDIFTAVGATNATWVWCPYMNPGGNPDLRDSASLYPGDAYVDWTCVDGYNRGTSRGGRWKSFGEVFGRDYAQITTRIAPSKPMLLGEVASSEQGGSKAGWIGEMFARLPTEFPAVRALLWFDYYDQGDDWPLETSAAAGEAFAAGIAAPRYLGNSFAALAGAGPVPLP